MKEIKSATNNFTKKMAISASAASIALKEIADGTAIKLKAAALIDDVDNQTGEVKEVAVFVGTNDVVYSSISSNAVDIATDICGIMDSGEEVTITVLKRVSKSGNEFISLLVS